MTQTPTPLVWTCPGCQTQVPVPTPAKGIISCPTWDSTDDLPPPLGAPCGDYAYSLDSGGLADLINTQQIEPVAPGSTPRLLGDCEGCTPQEAREFEARFPLLDVIDREHRLSREE